MSFDKNKIQELYPEAVMYEAMKIHASTDNELRTASFSGDWFGQLKKDGFWYQFEKHKNNSYLFSRTISKKTSLQVEKLANVPHIAAALNCLPSHTILIGEIYYPGKTSKNAAEIMGCLSDKAIERQKGERGLIHYYIHDILMYQNVDLYIAKVNNFTRYQILKKIFQIYNLNQYNFIELAEVWEDNLYERIGQALSNGEEGMVLKKKTGLYEPGLRPRTNLKAKKVDFAEAIIIGFESPTKEYYGKELDSWNYWIENSTQNKIEGFFSGVEGYTPITKPYFYGWNNARIHIGAYDQNNKIKDIGIIHSGISDEMKEKMTLYPEKYLNQVCQIQMMEKDFKEYTIRHGFFRGLREDKNPQDCTLESIF